MNAHTKARALPDTPAAASQARAALRARIAERTAAAEALATATAKAARARVLLEAAQRQLAGLGDVDGAIKAHQAAAYVALAEGGGELAAPALDVPPALAERQERVRAAAAGLAAAEAAHASIQAERTAAATAETRAEASVFDAARTAMAEHADDIALRLDAAMAAAFVLADELEALAMLSAPGPGQTWAEGRLRLSPAAMRRATTPLGHDGRPWLPAPQSYAGRRLPAVQQYFEALRRDADAVR
jgi:hypothetical protein